MLLSFTTLACPDWTLEQIILRAGQYGYDGIEFRGLLDEVDITRRPEFQGEERARARRLLSEAGLAVAGLGSSVHCLPPSEPEMAVREREEFVRYLDLASELDGSTVRLFGGTIPSGMGRDEATGRAADKLREFSSLAQQAGVPLVVESHDSFVLGRDLANLLEECGSANVGALWDVFNSQSSGEESLEETFSSLREKIRHVHVKDGVFHSNGCRYTALGDGQIPYGRILGWLQGAGYQGWLSVEWEKRWHPELPEPDRVLPQYANELRCLLAALPQPS